MVTVARVRNNGDVLLTREVNERLPFVQSGLVAHYPLDGTTRRYVPNQIRYIRDYLGYGSTANASNHWIEIQAFDENGVNVALNKSAVNSLGVSIPQWVDGSTDTNQWSITGMSSGSYHTVDLGDLYTITSIKHWHYWGDGRKYYKTRVAVSADNIHWFDVFDSQIEGEYNETSAGHTINLVDPGATLLPVLNNNTTLTDNYVAVEDSTTNVVGFDSTFESFNVGDTAGFTNQLGTGSILEVSTERSKSGTKSLKIAKGSGGSSRCYRTVSASTGEWITFSADVFCTVPNSVMLKFELQGGDYTWSPTEGAYHSGKGWERISVTYPSALTSNTTVYFFIYEKSGIPAYVENLQMEKKAFPTHHVSDSRSGNGEIRFPFPYKPPYAINIWHTGIKPLSQVTDQSSSPMIFQLGGYYQNASISFWNYIKTLRLYIKGNSSSAWTATTSGYYTFTSETWDNKEHMYTLAAVDNRTFRVYMDGKYLGQLVSTEDVTNIPFLSMGNTSYPNAKYRDLSIYNRSLTDEEVEQMYAQSFKVTEQGNLIIRELCQKVAGCPSDAIHIPLDFNAKDRLGLLGPSAESNAVYEEGSVFIGNTLTNQYNYPNFDTSTSSGGWAHWNASGGIGSHGQNTDRSFIFSHDNKYSHWVANSSSATGNYLCYQSPAFDGGLRSLQVILCMEDGSPVTNDKVYPAWNAGTGSVQSGTWTSIKRIGVSKWYICKAEGFTQDGTNDLVGFYVKPGQKVYVDRAQLEPRPFCSPITLGVRGDGELEFNLYRDYKIDWSKDWTLVFWKKPMGTQNNTLTGYNIESLGCNSNSVGGGYHWFGKTSGANTINLSSSGAGPTFNPADYFGDWQMVSLTKSGTTVTFTNWSRKMGNVVRTLTLSTSVPNYYVTQYGYDFKLNGWDNQGAANSFFKDLIIAKRAFSQTELETLFNINARAYKDKFVIQGSLSEGQTL